MLKEVIQIYGAYYQNSVLFYLMYIGRVEKYNNYIHLCENYDGFIYVFSLYI